MVNAFESEGVGAAFKTESTYISVLSITLCVYMLMKRRGGMNERLVKVNSWIWFLFGFVQTYIKSDFGHYLVIRQSTNLTRGVVGCATEPSAYGYVGLIMILLAFRFKKHRVFYIGLWLFQILGLAGSTVSLIYVGVYIVAYVINDIMLRKKFAVVKSLVILGGGIGALFYLNAKQLLPSRMGILVNYAFAGRWNMIYNDGSVHKRLGGVIDSFVGFWQNRGIPQGFGIERPFSGIGIYLLECGIFSIPFLAAVGWIIWKAYPGKYRFIFTFGFLVVMISTITFSSPIVCFYLGACMYWREERIKKQRELRNARVADRNQYICYNKRLYY
jgi:hypothetical protein